MLYKPERSCAGVCRYDRTHKLKSSTVKSVNLLSSIRLQAHSAEELSSAKAEHLRVLDQLRATHALEHSSSKVAGLANKLNTKEVLAH